MKIPFLDLKAVNAPYKEAFNKTFLNFQEKGWYVLGEEVRLFEEEFAAYCGAQHCIGTANGLDALRLILEGYKILGKLSEGDEVLVASNTYIATILSIKQANLIPVLIEAEDKTYNFDFRDLNKKVTERTKVVMPTHLYGQLADMEQVLAFAKANNLLTITDCAQAHGAQDKKRNHAGSLADAAGFSFYPTKNLGALGDAGAVTTNDTALTAVIRKYRNYGFEKRYIAEYEGVNSRLDELQAAFLRTKLKDLDIANARRREIARYYLESIVNDKLSLPFWDGSESHVFHLFVIRTQERDKLKAFLEEHNIATSVHYPVPPHKQKALSKYAHLSFPVTEKMYDELLSIPLNPALKETEIDFIIEVLNAF